MKRFHTSDVVLYGSISFLTVMIATPDPITWRGLAAAVLQTLITIKAKRSIGKEKETNLP